nr:hypothetical protein [Halolamina pelagica]
MPEEAVRLEAEILSNNSWDLALTVRWPSAWWRSSTARPGASTANTACPNIHRSLPRQHWRLYVKGPHDDDYQLKQEWGNDGG